MFGIDDAILGTVGAGLVNNLFASNRQEDAQAFSAQQYATRYQTQVKDLQAAGLNPMLAYVQGPGSAPTSSAASSSGMGDVGQTINQTKMTSAQVANIAADTENKKAQADLIAAQAAAAWASAGQSQANVGQINASTQKIIEETKNIPIEGQRLRYAIQLLAEDAALAAQRGETQVSIRNEIAAKISKLKTETKLLNFDASAAEDLGNLGRYSKEGKVVLDVIRELRRK